MPTRSDKKPQLSRKDAKAVQNQFKDQEAMASSPTGFAHESILKNFPDMKPGDVLRVKGIQPDQVNQLFLATKSPQLSLLEKRIAEFDIPAWPGQALFERVFVYRLPDQGADSETYIPGGAIVKAEMVHENQKARSPRGVIVSAGLGALDVMAAHGMQVGELVWISPHVAHRFDLGKDSSGHSIEFYFMNVGDIISSEDVLTRLSEEDLRVTCIEGEHRFYDASGTIERNDPSSSPDDI